MLDALLLAGVPLLPLSAAPLVRFLPGPWRPALAARAVSLSFLLAILIWLRVLTGGPLHLALVSIPTASRPITLGLQADRLGAAMLLLVTGVSSLVHLFSARAMRGDRHERRFFVQLGAVTAAVLLLLLSDSLLLLFLCWGLKGLLLAALLGHYGDRPAARRAVARKVAIDLIGIAAFALAVVATWHAFGTLDLDSLFAQARAHPDVRWVPPWLHLGAVDLIALLLLVAAMAKSAQVPLHAWLPDSLETPTPVSALMHAGLVNAGGFLLVRLSPLFVLSPFALHLAFAVGTLTALHGSLVMSTRSDVKGMLAWSTMSQMGFMFMECGIGAFALAIVHLISHGIYKAAHFLNAGSAVADAGVDRALAAPGGAPSPPGVAARLVALVVPLVAVLLVHAHLGTMPGGAGAPLLLLFAWATGARVVLRVVRAGLARPAVLGASVAALTALYAAYLVAAGRFAAYLAPVLPAPRLVAASAVGTVPALVAATLALAAFAAPWLAGRPPFRALERRLYVFALHRGYVDEIGLLVLDPVARLARRLLRPVGGAA